MTSVAIRGEHSARQPAPTIIVAGAQFAPEPCGALWWPGERLLAVADLHLEKGSALARRGALLPPYDTSATLARLAAVVSRRQPRIVVALGDSFHDTGAGERIDDASREAIAGLQRGRDWIWIAGNHDPRPPTAIGGAWYEELAVGPVVFRHEPDPASPAGEIAGHLHPVAKVSLKGRGLRRRCFAGDGRRLVMPAFGAYAGGLNVLDVAYRGLFSARDLSAWMVGNRAVYPLPSRRLLPD